jgi:hypothetical protein
VHYDEAASDDGDALESFKALLDRGQLFVVIGQS